MNRAYLVAIAKDVAKWAIVTFGSVPDGLGVRGSQDVLLLDDTTAGTGELVHAIMLHLDPSGELEIA